MHCLRWHTLRCHCTDTAADGGGSTTAEGEGISLGWPCSIISCVRDTCCTPPRLCCLYSNPSVGDVIQEIDDRLVIDHNRSIIGCQKKSNFTTLHATVKTLSPFKQPFSRWIWVSRYQNVSILDFTGAKEVVLTNGAIRRARLQ